MPITKLFILFLNFHNTIIKVIEMTEIIIPIETSIKLDLRQELLGIQIEFTILKEIYRDIMNKHNSTAREHENEVFLEYNFIITRLFDFMEKQNLLLIVIDIYNIQDYEKLRENLILEMDYRKLILQNKYSVHKEINTKVNNQFLERIYKQEIDLSEKQKENEMLKQIIKNKDKDVDLERDKCKKVMVKDYNDENNEMEKENAGFMINISDCTYHTFSMKEENAHKDALNIEENGGNGDSCENGSKINEDKKEVNNHATFKVDTINEVNLNSNTQNTLNNDTPVFTKEIEKINEGKNEHNQTFNGTIQILNKSFSKIVEDLIDEKLEVNKMIDEIENNEVIHFHKLKMKDVSGFVTNINSNEKDIKQSPTPILKKAKTKTHVRSVSTSSNSAIESNNTAKTLKKKQISQKSVTIKDNISSIKPQNKSININTSPNGKSLTRTNSSFSKTNCSIKITENSVTSTNTMNTIHNTITSKLSNESNMKYAKKLLDKYHKVIENYNKKVEINKNTKSTSKDKVTTKVVKQNRNLEKFITNPKYTPNLKSKQTTPLRKNNISIIN